MPSRYFGVAEGGNFEGKSILTLTGDPEEYADEVERIREQLYEARAKRVWPGRDEKIITSWNGMMIRALAEGGLVLGPPGLHRRGRPSAQRSCSPMSMWMASCTASYGGGSARIPAFLEDYAQLIDGLMALYEATLDLEWLRWARDLVGPHDRSLRRRGGVASTTRAAQHDQLAIRPRETPGRGDAERILDCERRPDPDGAPDGRRE